MEIKTTDLFAKTFTPSFRKFLENDSTEHYHNGGRGSGKSSFVSLAIVLGILQNKDWNALVLRKVKNTLYRSVYGQISWAINKLGVASSFRFLKSPMQIEYIPTGQLIVFEGADDPTKIKSLKINRGYIAMLWFEELEEFKRRDIDDIGITTKRGGEVFKTFYTFNAPSSPRHWVNQMYLEPKKPGAIKHHSTYLDVSQAWLGSEFLKDAEHLQKTRPEDYRNIYLGEAIGTGKQIFTNITIKTITNDEIKSFEWFYFGMDWGWYPDPTRFVAMAYDSNGRRLYIFDELTMYKTPNDEGSQKLRDHVENKPYAKHWTEISITADNSHKDIGDFRADGWDIRAAVKGVGSVEAGFKWLQGLTEIIIDAERAPLTADEFLLYEYELHKKTGEILSGYPQGQPDHSLACVRYALERVWRRKGT